MNFCQHESPPYERQIKASPLPSAGESPYAPCVHCGAPLKRARDDAMWTGWVRARGGWKAYLGALDESPEFYTRDGLPPEEQSP